MKYIGAWEARKNPKASSSCYSHSSFISFHLNSCNSTGLGTLLKSGINKHLSALPGKLNCWNNARCYIPRTICHTTFELQFTGISSPSPSVKQSMEQISHLLFDSPALLTWAVSRNAVLFAIQITDYALLLTSHWKRTTQVISLVWDVQRLSTPTSSFLWLHSLGSAIGGHDHPRAVHFIIAVCQNNLSPVEFSCTQCNEGTKRMCIILEGS